MNRDAIVLILCALGIIVGVGMVFFHIVEGWSWLDSYFFTVITLSTVGYGSLVPVTALGKIGTTVFIFMGLGVFALAIQQLSQITISGRIIRRGTNPVDPTEQDNE